MSLKSLGCFCLIFSVLLTSCSKSPATTATQSGNWIKSSEFEGVARAEAVSFVIGDTAYISTGYTPNNPPGSVNGRLSDLWSYSFGKGWLHQGADFPGTARNSAVAFTAGTKGYVGTGYDGVNYLKDFWEYNPATGAWAKKASFGGSARYDAVAFGIGANGYVSTGFDGNYLKDFWQYNPAADSWTQLTSMGGFKRSGAVAFVYNNKGYITTGANNGSTSSVNDLWVYDPATGNGGTWTQKRAISNVSTESYDDAYAIVRNNAVAFVMGGKAYVSTGDNGNGTLFQDTWEYDFATDQWVQKSNFEGLTRNGAVGFSLKDRGFIATGKNNTQYFDDFWELHPNETLNPAD